MNKAERCRIVKAIEEKRFFDIIYCAQRLTELDDRLVFKPLKGHEDEYRALEVEREVIINFFQHHNLINDAGEWKKINEHHPAWIRMAKVEFEEAITL